MKKNNQTSNSKSDRKWRARVLRQPTVPLFNRFNTAVKQAKIGLSSRGFVFDLALAVIERNRLEDELKRKGLTPSEIRKLEQIRKDIKLAKLLQELRQ